MVKYGNYFSWKNGPASSLLISVRIEGEFEEAFRVLSLLIVLLVFNFTLFEPINIYLFDKGLTFRKDLFLASAQIYPPDPALKRPTTRLQERLIKKLGENAHPFYFELPPHCPASVTLQPAPGIQNKKSYFYHLH